MEVQEVHGGAWRCTEVYRVMSMEVHAGGGWRWWWCIGIVVQRWWRGDAEVVQVQVQVQKQQLQRPPVQVQR